MDKLSSEEVTFPPLSVACLSVMLIYDDVYSERHDGFKTDMWKDSPQQSLCYIKINVTLHLV